ncbi:GDSL-type esterase/lipase family protein [Lentisphaera profundi]|uniref:GDSL-type esterase/lipase family protein n=1 Tax=Lentisphaera profundi TaxID=1658616 RepID=A0ABY7VNQ7_9BACT|nr:GDSL-type esterase/lipase family protein [Lentisphaera profundi]WDE95763.1 GDSL-type esterase/lipase family protein [Lentisphaera profundi]
MKISLLIFTMISLNFTGHIFAQETAYPSPLKFEGSIKDFEKQEERQQTPKNAIVVTGSSTIVGWKSIHDDLKPLTIIPRGFGGSNMNDLYHYSEQLIIKHKPRAVVIYEGDNDLIFRVSPKQIKNKFIKLKDKLLKADKKLRIYLISVKPSIARKSYLEKAKEVNEIFKDLCNSSNNLYFIDTFSPMMDGDKIKKDVFLKDKLHYNDTGYKIWTQAVLPVLLKNELKFEKK